jgi:hypothetical protein
MRRTGQRKIGRVQHAKAKHQKRAISLSRA